MFYLQLVRNMVHGVYVLVLAGVGISRNVFEGTSYVVEFMLKALVWMGVRVENNLRILTFLIDT